MVDISIIVPVYNRKERLKQCIDSILRQSFRSFELLLVDDGSTDGSSQICDEYKEIDFRVKVIHKKNGGVSSARNAGLSYSIGKSIVFIDSDDRVDEVYLETLYDEFLKNKSQLVISKVYRELDKKNVEKYTDSFITITQEMSSKQFALLLEKEYICGVLGKLYAKEAVENLRFREDMHFGEDLVFNFEVLRKNISISLLNSYLYCYCYEPNGLSTGFRSTKPTDFLVVYNTILDYMDFRGFFSEDEVKIYSKRILYDFLWAIEQLKNAPADFRSNMIWKYVQTLGSVRRIKKYIYKGISYSKVKYYIKILLKLDSNFLWYIYVTLTRKR